MWISLWKSLKNLPGFLVVQLLEAPVYILHGGEKESGAAEGDTGDGGSVSGAVLFPELTGDAPGKGCECKYMGGCKSSLPAREQLCSNAEDAYRIENACEADGAGSEKRHGADVEINHKDSSRFSFSFFLCFKKRRRELQNRADVAKATPQASISPSGVLSGSVNCFAAVGRIIP